MTVENGCMQKKTMRSVLDFFEETVKRYPDKTAFADEKGSCTFQELKDRARKIGSYLADKVEPRDPVPVLMEKSTDTMAVFLGCIYAGAFYVLLDIKHPKSRIDSILDTLECGFFFSSEEFQKEAEAFKGGREILWLEEADRTPADDERLERINGQRLDTDPLYCNFTSGSTGVPKGVLVGHQSVIDFISEFTRLFHITEEDVIGNQAPWDFDVSVKDIYSGLMTGATVQIIPRRFFSIPVQLMDFLCERKITTLTWAVSALCIITTLKGFDYRVPDTIRKVMFSGEVMPVKHLNLWKKYVPDAEYVNLYGPTEITCNCTYYRIDRDFERGEAIPIGRAFPNERVFLLDEEDREVTEPEVPGEICVAGSALALGYYNNPEQTARAFVQNPLNKKYPERIYRTGDLGYYDKEGELYYKSRKDFQIKHMGHRIELGEIEAVMNRVDEILRCCCLFDEKRNRITAFYEGGIDKKELKKKMGESLPMFMLPNVFYDLEEMPLTKNGKIDRGYLKKTYLDD